jgi:hypothetical protein
VLIQSFAQRFQQMVGIGDVLGGLLPRLFGLRLG